jgi:hypothetical protein
MVIQSSSPECFPTRAMEVGFRQGLFLQDHSGMGISPGKVSAVGVSERWCVMARLQLWSSMMAGGSSKGWNQLGLHQTGVAWRRQARREVAMAQNTVEWWRFVWKQQLGFSSVFAKIPHDSSLIYRGFACRSRTTRIRLRLYLQSMFELSFGWDLVDFWLGK